MGVYDIAKGALIKALDGYTVDEVRSLCNRANNMCILAKAGKYTDAKLAIMVIGHDRIIDRITTLLGFPRRKCRVPKVEIIRGGGAREVPVAPSEVVDETCSVNLLAKIAGPSIRAQLDIKRECIPSTSEIEELQREEQVLDVVPSNRFERVQPDTPIQAS